MSKSWKIHTQTSIITWIEEKIIFFLSTCNSALKFHSTTGNNYSISGAAEQFEKGEDGYFINFIPNLL